VSENTKPRFRWSRVFIGIFLTVLVIEACWMIWNLVPMVARTWREDRGELVVPALCIVGAASWILGMHFRDREKTNAE